MELSELSQSDQEQHAFFLGLAALLGEGVYNLGELVREELQMVYFFVGFCWRVICN